MQDFYVRSAACIVGIQFYVVSTSGNQRWQFKGEVNLNIKLHLNDSFYTLINKYHPHIKKSLRGFKEISKFRSHFTYLQVSFIIAKIGTIYCIYLGGVSLYFC